MLNVGGLDITPNLIIFGMLASLSALAAAGVVLFRNAVRSALCLVVNFFLLAFIYFTLNAEMLGITQILVYTGAIMVLFLFVIMLLNLGAPQILNEQPDYVRKGLGSLFGLILFGLVASQLFLPIASYASVRAPEHFGSPQAVGRTLFTLYVVPFEVVSILLLVGIVGSILLAKRKV